MVARALLKPLEKLKETGFRISDKVVDRLLKKLRVYSVENSRVLC